MVVLLGVVLGAIAFAQVAALAYAQQRYAKGDSNVERMHRDTAINITVLLTVAALMMAPGPWFKEEPVKGVYTLIARNLKPRDKKGNGWLEPQAYSSKKEEKAAVWMYALIHKTLLAVLVAGVAGIVSGALTKALEKQVKSSHSLRR